MRESGFLKWMPWWRNMSRPANHVLWQPQGNYQPLQQSTIPDHPWQHVATDLKGPVGNQFYFLLVIDEYSRFPAVEIVTTTAADKVLPLFDKIFTTHGTQRK